MSAERAGQARKDRRPVRGVPLLTRQEATRSLDMSADALVGVTGPQLEAVAQRVAQLVADLAGPEPWLDKRGLAAHLACSVRSIEQAMAEGLPHAVIFGRAKFRVSDVEPWLARYGHLRRLGDHHTLADIERSADAVET